MLAPLTQGLNASNQDTQRSFKILAFGDSLTAGYRLDKNLAYPQKLEELLNKNSYPVKITNAGVSGDTSAQGLRRLDWSLRKGGPFDFALLALGANDGLRRQPLDQLENNLRQIVRKLQEQNTRVFLLGIKLPINFDAQYRENFEKVFVKISKEMKVPLYPFILEGLAMDQRYNLEDMIHPNAKGHEVIAENLKKWILRQSEFTSAFKK